MHSGSAALHKKPITKARLRMVAVADFPVAILLAWQLRQDRLRC